MICQLEKCHIIHPYGVCVRCQFLAKLSKRQLTFANLNFGVCGVTLCSTQCFFLTLR